MVVVFEFTDSVVSLYGIVSQGNITLSIQADVAEVSAEQTMEFLSQTAN